MTRNQEKFLTLMEHYGEATEYAKVAAESSGTALEKFNNSYLGSIQASQDAFKAQYEQLTNNILNGGLIKFTYDGSTGILGFFNSIIETFKTFPTLAATTMGVMSGVFDKNIVNVVDKEGSKFFGKGFDFSLFGLLDGNKLSKDVEVFERMADSIKGITKEKKIIQSLRKDMDNLCDTNKKWVQSLINSGQSADVMKTEINNMSESLNKMSISSKASAIGMKALNLAMNVGLMLAVSWAIQGTVYVLDNLIHHQEKAIEKSKELAENVKNLKDEISSMEEELRTTKDRLQELNGLDNPSFTEQSELDNLKIQNKELELQLELKRKLLEIEQADSNKAAMETIETYKPENIANTPQRSDRGYIQKQLHSSDIFENTQFKMDTVDKYKEHVADLEEQNLSLDANTSQFKKNAKEIDNYKNSIKTLDNSITKNIASLNETNSQLKGIDEESINTKQRIGDLTNTWDKWINADKTDRFNKVLDSDKFKDIKEEVLGLNNLTAENLETNYPELVEDLNTVGIYADDAAKHIKSLNNQVSNTPDLFNSLTDVLNSFAENAKLIKNVKEDIKNMGAISDDVLSKLSEKYPDLITSILQYKLGLLSVNDVYSLIQSKYSEDVANQEQALTQKLLNEQWFINGIISGNKQILDYLNHYYQGDVEQFVKFVKTKVEIEKLANQVLLESEIATLKGKENAEIAMAEASIKRLEEQKNAAITATKVALSLMGVNEIVASQLLSKVTDPLDKKIDKLKVNLKDIKGTTIKSFDISSIKKYTDAINTTKASVKDLKQEYQNAQSAINSLLTMTMNMLKQKYADEKKALQDRINNLKESQKLEKENLENELNGLNKKIEAQLKLLQLRKESYDYNNNLDDKKSEVSNIESELVKLQFDDSAEANAKRLKLKEELAQKQKELDDLQFNHSIKLQEDALNDEKDKNKEIYDNKIDRLEKEYNSKVETLEKEVKAVEEYTSKECNIRQEAIKLIEGKTQNFYNQLIKWNYEYGDGLNSTVTNSWNSCYKAMDVYNQGQYNVINTLNVLSNKMNEVSNKAKLISSNTTNAINDIQRLSRMGSTDRGIYPSKSYYDGDFSLPKIPKRHNGGLASYNGSENIPNKYKQLFNLANNETLFKLNKDEMVLTRMQQDNLIEKLQPKFPLNIFKPQNSSDIRMGDIIIQGNASQDTVDLLYKYQKDIVNQVFNKINKHK